MEKATTPTSGLPSAVFAQDDLVLAAMRLAEYAHRQQSHFRKAPEGEDKPAYFLHLAEVAWLLQDAGLPQEIVAAGYLHDMIEDCGYTREDLAEAIGNDQVADLVARVSEPEKSQSWEVRNQAYLRKMKEAPPEILALSCADKTSNLRDMVRMVERGHALGSFMSRNKAQQLDKFKQLDQVFHTVVPESIYRRFAQAWRYLEACA